MTNAHLVNVSVTFKNTDSSEALKKYATEKLSAALGKFVHHPTEVHTILRLEKNRQIAEATFHADGHDFKGKEESEDLYASIDSLVASVTQQLRKHKEKLTEHHP
jgi:putative sigma-54 modulation protein